MSTAPTGAGEYGADPVLTLPSAATTTAFVSRSSSGSEIGFAVSSVVYQFANNVMLTISLHMPFAAGQHTTVDVSLSGASASNYSLSGSFPGHDWHGQGCRDTADIALTPAATPGKGTTSPASQQQELTPVFQLMHANSGAPEFALQLRRPTHAPHAMRPLLLTTAQIR